MLIDYFLKPQNCSTCSPINILNAFIGLVVLILIILESFLKIVQKTTILAPVLKSKRRTLLYPALLIFR